MLHLLLKKPKQKHDMCSGNTCNVSLVIASVCWGSSLHISCTQPCLADYIMLHDHGSISIIFRNDLTIHEYSTDIRLDFVNE